MYLKELTLHNFRCFHDLEVEFHPQLTVLVGSNGAGKTSILEGAAVAVGTLFCAIDNVPSLKLHKSDGHLEAYRIGSNDDIQPQFPVEVSACAVMAQGEDSIRWKRSLKSAGGDTTVRDAKAMTALSASYQERLRKGDTSLILPVIAYYGAGRLWDYRREKTTDAFRENTRTNGYVGCLDGIADLKLMMNWFKKMTIRKYQRQEENLDSLPELDAVLSAMEQCFTSVTGYRDVKIRYNLNTNSLDVYYTDENGLRMRIPLSQMSDGYQVTLSLVADIAYRCACLNPQLLDEVLVKTDGVVLIDEIDLHLHPEWQQRILGDLAAIFPKVQFIVSTHAPAVINSVHSENMLILKDYRVGHIESQIYGKDVKSVLNEIMGVNERPLEVAKLFEKFYEFLKDGAYDEAEEALDEIDRLRDFHDAEVAGCRVKLKLERMRGGRA